MPEELKQSDIDELQNLNPQVASATVGVRSLRKINIYPLSVGDQMKMTNILASKVVGFLSAKEANNDEAMVGFFINIINENISKFLGLSTCEKPDEEGNFPESEKLLSDITNLQISEIALLIYKMNFEESSKNFVDLFKKAKKLFQLERSLPPSVKDTITDLNTSLGEASEKEA